MGSDYLSLVVDRLPHRLVETAHRWPWNLRFGYVSDAAGFAHVFGVDGLLGTFASLHLRLVQRRLSFLVL